MSSTARCFWFVFLCGATLAPVGDHFHVARGVTRYHTDFGPIWFGNSPLWFVVLVASFLAVVAVLQGLAARARGPGSSARVFLSPLWVAGLYLTTSFYPWRDAFLDLNRDRLPAPPPPGPASRTTTASAANSAPPPAPPRAGRRRGSWSVSPTVPRLPTSASCWNGPTR